MSPSTPSVPPCTTPASAAAACSRPSRRVRLPASTDVEVRIGTAEDLDAIAALSQIELAHRSTPPIYAPPQPRTLARARAVHERLLGEGALHFLARRADRDVGLVTLELTSPAPRLCPDGLPYIGATASHPSVRGQGIGSALVHAVLDWAHSNGARHRLGRLRLREPAVTTVLARPRLRADGLPDATQHRSRPTAGRGSPPGAFGTTPDDAGSRRRRPRVRARSRCRTGPRR